MAGKKDFQDEQGDLFGEAGDTVEKPDKKGGPKKGKVHPTMRAGEIPEPPHRPYEIIKEGKYIAWLLNL